MRDMKKISLSVSTRDYEAFRVLAAYADRPIAEMIREAMASYLSRRPRPAAPLRTLRTFHAPRPVAPLPQRADLWDDIASRAADGD